MSVSPVNDKALDLFAAAQARSRDDDRDGKSESPDAAAVETSFSQMLKGRLSGNMVFTRLDQQLSVPQRAEPSSSRAPIADRRDQAPKDKGVDPYDPNGDLKKADRRAPPSAAASDKSQPKSGDQVVTEAMASGMPQAAANANMPGDPSKAQAQAAGRTTAEAGVEQAGAGNRAAIQATANAASKGEAVTPEVIEQARQAAKSGSQKIAATVTEEGGRISSQPQSTLGARAAVNADATQRQGEGSALQMLGGADSFATAEAEGSANNIFNRLKAQAGAGKGNEQGKGHDAGDPSKTQPAAPTQPNLAAPAAPASGLAAAGGQFSALTGTGQSGLVVDGATGGTASLGENNSLQQRSAANPAASASRPPPVPPHVIAEQVAVNVQRGLAQGQDRITVQLRPQELGRVEIKMDMGHDGKMTAVVSAERPETLDMLRQDSRTLIQSLNDAGLQVDQNSLSFSLQGQNDGSGTDADTARGNDSGANSDTDGDDPFQTGFNFEETGGFSSDGRLDVRI